MTPGNTDFPRPFTTVDVVIFTVRETGDEARLDVLLVQRPGDPGEPFPGHWALPGGFVDIERDTDLEACARRKLREKTGVDSPYLEQLGSWGGATRDPRGWSATHVYFALIPGRELRLERGANAGDVAWFAVDEVLQWALPVQAAHTAAAAEPAAGTTRHARNGLAFDHAEILQTALERLRGKVEYTSLPAYLLVEPFSLPQLQQIYEVVLGRPVDKSGFRTRMLAADFLEEAGIVPSSARRPTLGYRLKDRSAPVVFPRTFGPKRGG